MAIITNWAMEKVLNGYVEMGWGLGLVYHLVKKNRFNFELLEHPIKNFRTVALFDLDFWSARFELFKILTRFSTFIDNFSFLMLREYIYLYHVNVCEPPLCFFEKPGCWKWSAPIFELEVRLYFIIEMSDNATVIFELMFLIHR